MTSTENFLKYLEYKQFVGNLEEELKTRIPTMKFKEFSGIWRKYFE